MYNTVFWQVCGKLDTFTHILIRQDEGVGYMVAGFSLRDLVWCLSVAEFSYPGKLAGAFGAAEVPESLAEEWDQ